MSGVATSNHPQKQTRGRHRDGSLVRSGFLFVASAPSVVLLRHAFEAVVLHPFC
jgi:hypothetical protein